jgi:peptidoglycan-associated lipoprotein
MRLNKTFKNVVIALPLLALAACSSNDESDELGNTETNANTEVTQQVVEDSVQVTAAKRAAAIEEQKRQELAKLRSEHIIYFDFDVSNVSQQYASVLDAHAKFLNANSC